MSIRLVAGTKEFVDVTVEDTEGVLTTLDGTTPKYDVWDTDTAGADDTHVVTAASALNSGMMIQCLLDTTGWAKGLYHLYVSFTIGSEVPVLGPFDIYLI